MSRAPRSLIALGCLGTVLVAGVADSQPRRPGGRGGGGFGQGQQQPPPGQPSPPGTRQGRGPADAPDHVSVDGERYPLATLEVMELLERGQGRAALAAYERAAADAETRGAKTEAMLAHGAVTFVAVRSGMAQKAIKAGTRALELLKEVPSSPAVVRGVVTAYSALGSAYRTAGDFAQARRVLEEGIAAIRAQASARDNAGLGVLYWALASVANAQKDPATAVRVATEGVQVVEQSLQALPERAPERARVSLRRQAANLLVLAGRAHLALGHRAEAEAVLARGRSYARMVQFAEIELEIVTVSAELAAARGDHPKALELYDEAKALGQKIGRVPSMIGVHAGRMRSYAATGRYDEALAAARDVMKIFEEVRGELQDSNLRGGFLDDKQGIYQAAVRFALRLNRTDEAFAIAESSRARAFLDLLGSQTTLSKGRTRALVDEEVKLRARIAEARALVQDGAEESGSDRARQRLDAAEREYRSFLERVRKENAEQASLMTVDPVTLADVQALLPEGTTLLEYLVGDDEVIVWVVDRQRATTRRVKVDRADLVREVREFRTAIADQAPIEQVQQRAEALYRQLIGAARSEIHGRRVLVVPHDVLHYLPFAALRSPGGKWLVEDFALATLPSASVLKFLAGKGAQASDRALAVGNPDVGAGLNLRWAEREARLVGQRLPSTTVLVRGDATESRAKQLLESSGLIHFALHGELNENDPLGSALLLVPGGSDDGRLEVRELFGLDLHAKLVVLSACETGLGKLSRGDEFVGLQRAFLYAGTPAVVTTLWKVDDRASYDLVRAFYDRFAADGAVAALRQAQITTMGAHPHPFAWAAFGLTGAPQ